MSKKNVYPLSTIDVFGFIPNIPARGYISELKNILGDCQSVLDVGCGENSPIGFINIKTVTGIDIYKPAIEISKQKRLHHRYVIHDIRKLETKFRAKSFDACIALDVIEHLTKQEGKKLIKSMSKIARKRIIIFTPNGWVDQEGDHNKYQAHHSSWTVSEMEKLGFKVIGMFGPKLLRGEKHSLKIKPKIIGGIISELSNYFYTRRHPIHAAAILCVKDIDHKN